MNEALGLPFELNRHFTGRVTYGQDITREPHVCCAFVNAQRGIVEETACQWYEARDAPEFHAYELAGELATHHGRVCVGGVHMGGLRYLLHAIRITGTFEDVQVNGRGYHGTGVAIVHPGDLAYRMELHTIAPPERERVHLPLPNWFLMQEFWPRYLAEMDAMEDSMEKLMLLAAMRFTCRALFRHSGLRERFNRAWLLTRAHSLMTASALGRGFNPWVGIYPTRGPSRRLYPALGGHSTGQMHVEPRIYFFHQVVEAARNAVLLDAVVPINYCVPRGANSVPYSFSVGIAMGFIHYADSDDCWATRKLVKYLVNLARDVSYLGLGAEWYARLDEAAQLTRADRLQVKEPQERLMLRLSRLLNAARHMHELGIY
jgi:hypothetical protein